MSKYIDAEKLKAEIERLKEETPIGICEYDAGEENGRMEVLTSLQSTIASLQQEQPVVDLEKEIDRFWDSCIKHKNERGGNVIWSNKIEIEVLARHFYELGLKARRRSNMEQELIPLPEERMCRYINYCLQREDDECHCPTCGKFVTGLRLFPYYYDRKNNDVYFASVCPECGKIIISKE